MEPTFDALHPGRLPVSCEKSRDDHHHFTKLSDPAAIKTIEMELSSSGSSILETSQDSPVVEFAASDTSLKILEIIFDYALNKFSDSRKRLEAGRPRFLSVIEKFVSARARVETCLPAFPFKCVIPPVC